MKPATFFGHGSVDLTIDNWKNLRLNYNGSHTAPSWTDGTVSGTFTYDVEE